MGQTRILVVEDEGIVAMDIRVRLESMDYEVTATVASGEEAIAQVRRTPPDLVPMDIVIQGTRDGVETAEAIRAEFDIPVIFLTANSDEQTLQRAKVTAPFGYLLKPFEDRELYTAIEMGLCRHRLECRLRESEQWLSTILCSIGDAVVVTDTDTRIEFMNAVAAELTGWEPDDALGAKSTDVLRIEADKGQGQDLDPVGEAMQTGKAMFLRENSVLITKSGDPIPISDSVAPIKDAQGNVRGAVLVFRDDTVRKKAEIDLQESERRYRSVIENAGESILVLRGDRPTLANPRAIMTFGCSMDEILSRSFTDFVHPDDRQGVLATFSRHHAGDPVPQIRQFRIIDGYGRTRWLEVNSVLTEWAGEDAILAFSTDITDRKVAEDVLQAAHDELERGVQERTAELQQANLELKAQILDRQRAEEQKRQLQEKLDRAERMRSLAMLAGGVAHDLNNTLGPLVGYPELILAQLPADGKVRKYVESMGRAASEAADVIQDLLTLARRGRYEMRPTDINQVMRDYLDSPNFTSLQESHSDVTLTVNLDPALPAIAGSSAHLSKVLMNLVVNAFDAMPAGGELAITTSRRTLDCLSGGYDKVARGGYSVVSIRDTGLGIDKKDRHRIFEPYFSDKKMGRSGSGLGLSVVYGVVKDHEGYYDVLSKLGEGTEFLLYFPVCAEEVSTADAAAASGGDELILVVDDMDQQRELASDLLGSLGYSVVTAATVSEAVDQIRAQRVDIAVLDMMLGGGCDGLDAYRQLLDVQPGLRAVIVSGYAQTSRVEQMQELGAGAFVRKPFAIADIDQAIRDELETTTPARVPRAPSVGAA